MPLSNLSRPIVPFVVSQHAADLATAWLVRRDHVRAPHVALRHLRRVDDRLAAHLDGCAVAGTAGLRIVLEALVDPAASALFAATAVALESGDRKVFGQCVSVAEGLPECASGLVSALGWMARERLANVGVALLDSPVPFQRAAGFAACRLHRVHPGSKLVAGLNDADRRVHVEALRCVAVLGEHDLSASLTAKADDSDIQFWTAWTNVLLGSRGTTVERLAEFATAGGPRRARAFRLTLQAMSLTGARDFLRVLPDESGRWRWLLDGAGIAGDPALVPWLIQQMQEQKSARAAGEAFTLITGADLALLDLERKPPEDFQFGPNDDPDDPNVDMDPDDGLPWPDVKKVEAWWHANEARFQKGTRYFMGQPVTKEHCIHVLKTGYQRQRVLAAQYLCLLEPGTPLFNTSAPAWRQQRLLAAM